MAVLVKPGVVFGFAPGGFRILEALKSASRTLMHDFTITSGMDGVHSGPNDPHYKANAYDIRTHDLEPQMKLNLLRHLRLALGARFYCFIESPGTDNEHIHAQTVRNSTYTILDYLADS